MTGAAVCFLKPKAFLYIGKKSGKMFAWSYSKTGANLPLPPAAGTQELVSSSHLQGASGMRALLVENALPTFIES